jgi:hypothetical protein
MPVIPKKTKVRVIGEIVLLFSSVLVNPVLEAEQGFFLPENKVKIFLKSIC